MSQQSNPEKYQPHLESYTYPQFIISETTGQIEVNFIDKESGRVIRHIPSTELSEIVRDYYLKLGTEANVTSKD